MTGSAAESDRTEAIRALEGEFAELFARVRRLMTERANRLHPGLMPGSYKVFTTIAHRAPVTLSGLAECLQADKGQISRNLRELETAGLIERQPDPDDRRSQLISPTEEGRARLDSARAPHGNPLISALEDWDTADIRQLTHLLHTLAGADALR